MISKYLTDDYCRNGHDIRDKKKIIATLRNKSKPGLGMLYYCRECHNEKRRPPRKVVATNELGALVAKIKNNPKLIAELTEYVEKKS